VLRGERLKRFLRRTAAIGLALLPVLLGAPLHAAVDCFADRVVVLQSGFADPATGFRHGELPGIVLGPPGDSLPVQGSTSTPALGYGGSITLFMDDSVIVDGPGPDFIVFENAFFKGSVPADPNASCFVFAEPGTVEVSDDGFTWHAFPYDASALAAVGQDQTACDDLPALAGLAGITPTFSGNWTVPDDPDAWEIPGTGGVGGAGGDAFDLAEVGLTQARYIRITDLDLGTGFAGPAEGFDLDAVVALHAQPLPVAGPDADGDRLTDSEEIFIHATDPDVADSDRDGTDDGVEAATCRDPLSASTAPLFHYEADLRFAPASTEGLRWNFPGGGLTGFDLIRGSIGDVDHGQNPIDLGPVTCIEENSFNLTSGDHPDTVEPAIGEAFYYLLRKQASGYGLASDGRPRAAGPGDCTP
jgi:hypothetical protein